MPDEYGGVEVHGEDIRPLPFTPTDFMFTAATLAGARTFLAGLNAPGELYEYEGRYYPVRRGSEDARWLVEAGATFIPAEDDLLHHNLDPVLAALQRG